MFRKKNFLLLPAIAIFGLFLLLASGLFVLLVSAHSLTITKLLESRSLVFFFLFYFNVIYIWGYKVVKKNGVKLRQIVVPGVVFAVLAFLILPLVSDDLYTYFYRSRIFVSYGANPYFDTYSKYFFDHYYWILRNDWVNTTALYGPFFWLVSSAISFLAASRLFAYVYLMKALFLTCFFVSIKLVYDITKSNSSVYLLGWNPIVIFFGLTDAHNDILVLPLVLASFYFAVGPHRKVIYYKLVSWLFFLLAALVKIYYLPLGFIVYYLILKDIGKFKEKIWVSGFLAIQSVVVGALLYMPFWRGPETLARLFQLHSFYEKVNYSFGAIAFEQEPVVGVALRVALGVLLVCFVFFLFLKLGKALVGNKCVENVYLYGALLYVLTLLNLSRVWNPWYWLFPLGILSLAVNYDGGKYSYKLIVFLCFFSSLYVFF